LAGETSAIAEFQATYGELIYAYPMRVYHIPRDDAGDFYVFALDNGRIFRRVQTFEGRTTLRAYLLGFVLDHLVLEWKRGEREIETVSIEAIQELPDEAMDSSRSDVPESGNRPSLAAVLAAMPPAKAVVLKLLYVEDCELSAADVRYIRKLSGRRIPEILAAIDRMRAVVREREAGLKRVEDQLEGVQAWIRLYERRLRRIATDLVALSPAAPTAASLRDEQADMERKIEWRQRQRANLVDRAQRRKVTTPYKDIAALLNTTVGNVASQILRVRKDAAARAQETDDAVAGEEDA
jgi:RNA polymerase sigma factor (sigma-70 family)